MFRLFLFLCSSKTLNLVYRKHKNETGSWWGATYKLNTFHKWSLHIPCKQKIGALQKFIIFKTDLTNFCFFFFPFYCNTSQHLISPKRYFLFLAYTVEAPEASFWPETLGRALNWFRCHCHCMKSHIKCWWISLRIKWNAVTV